MSVLLPVTVTVSKQLSQFLGKAFTNHHNPLLQVIGQTQHITTVQRWMKVVVLQEQDESSEGEGEVNATGIQNWSELLRHTVSGQMPVCSVSSPDCQPGLVLPNTLKRSKSVAIQWLWS